MAFTQEQLSALEEAIARGARKVRYQDKEVEYSSLDDMLKLRDKIAKELGLKSTAPSRKVAQFSKGTK